MADGITIPVTGTGDATPKVATDDTGTPGHVQLFKLAYSANGDATLVPAGALGLMVDHGTTGIGDGRKTVATAGTAAALVGSSTPARWVSITAETDNTGYVVVGASTVVASLATRRGTPLLAGDSLILPCDDLADIYIDVTVNGDGVTFTYGT